MAHRGQTVAVASVMGLGVFMFVASYGGYLDLDASYDESMERMALADWTLRVAGVTADDIRALARLDGVAAARGRLVADVSLEVPSAARGGGRARVDARIITLTDEDGGLDLVVVREGERPKAGEVLVEERFARHHGLERGARVTFTLGPTERAFTVAGLAVSAEYLWVARDRTDVMPLPGRFAVVWLHEGDARSLARDVDEAVRALGVDPAKVPPLAPVALAAAGAYNEVLLENVDDGARDGVLARVERALPDGALLEATAEEKLVGVEVLRLDVEGLRQMALFFPLFFLFVGAFIVTALLSRLVDAQRALIGTTLALGIARARVLRHYLGFALLVCCTGGVPGALLGLLGARGLTVTYAEELHLPYVTGRAHPGLFAIGLALVVVVALVAGILPARRAAALHPAESMRPAAPAFARPVGRSRLLRALPLPMRMALRNVARSPGRSLTTMLGVASSLVLLVVTEGVFESTFRAVDVQFEHALRYDVRLDLWQPEGAGALAARVAAIEGVADVELLLTAPVRLEAGGAHHDALVQAAPEGARLLRAVDFQNHDVSPAEGQLTLSRTFARKLDVARGDRVRVVPLVGDAEPFTLEVGAVSDLFMGGMSLMHKVDAERRFALEGKATTALVRARAGEEQAVLERLEALPGVARVEHLGGLRLMIEQYMGLAWVMLLAMLMLSAVLAAAILYNTATLAILERWRELATLRALGQRFSHLVVLVTVENAVLALAGLALGFLPAALLFRAAIRLWDSDMFSLPAVLSAETLLVCVLGIVVVLVMAELPALLAIRRMSLADAVRARE